jgi:hypothetical protein
MILAVAKMTDAPYYTLLLLTPKPQLAFNNSSTRSYLIIALSALFIGRCGQMPN